MGITRYFNSLLVSSCNDPFFYNNYGQVFYCSRAFLPRILYVVSKKFANRKINSKSYKKNQLKIEVTWSMVTALIFSIAGTITIILWQKGYTKVYTRCK